MGGAGMFDADPVSSWGSGDFSGGAAFFVFALVAAALSRCALHSHGGPSHAPQGLLCLIGRGRSKTSPPVQIYGPAGLRAYLRLALSFTGTRMLPPYVVHELHESSVQVGAPWSSFMLLVKLS